MLYFNLQRRNQRAPDQALSGGARLCGVDGRRTSECAELVRGRVTHRVSHASSLPIPFTHLVCGLPKTPQRYYITADMVTSAETVCSTSSITRTCVMACTLRRRRKTMNTIVDGFRRGLSQLECRLIGQARVCAARRAELGFCRALFSVCVPAVLFIFPFLA